VFTFVVRVVHLGYPLKELERYHREVQPNGQVWALKNIVRIRANE
jgi:hypothetical protein